MLFQYVVKIIGGGGFQKSAKVYEIPTLDIGSISFKIIKHSVKIIGYGKYWEKFSSVKYSDNFTPSSRMTVKCWLHG